jgi:glycosyltransferase involved in cell wall biosynthesis
MFPVEPGSSSDRKPRLLFCSWHSYLDPSSGAAICTRDLFELLAGRGWNCKVFCGPALDFDGTIAQVVGDLGVSYVEKPGLKDAIPFSLFHYAKGSVPVSIFNLAGKKCKGIPGKAEGQIFLNLCERVLDQYQPDILLTYGGNWAVQAVMDAARRRSIRVAFALHNFAYEKAKDLFAKVDAVLVPSRFAQAHYQKVLGLQSRPIPGPWNWANVRCSDFERRFVTFVNPQPHKGVFIFARIASELARLRPDIPMLVVEGRATAKWLERTGHDLTGVHNMHQLANTPDPKDFYRVSKIVLMPSLWWESFPRVAAESLINGIPVLGSNRGGIPEVLDQAGKMFEIPAQYTPESRIVATAVEVEPWIEAIVKLWDDANFYEQECARSLAAASKWHPDKLLPEFESFFTDLLKSDHKTIR